MSDRVDLTGIVPERGIFKRVSQPLQELLEDVFPTTLEAALYEREKIEVDITLNVRETTHPMLGEVTAITYFIVNEAYVVYVDNSGTIHWTSAR